MAEMARKKKSVDLTPVEEHEDVFIEDTEVVRLEATHDRTLIQPAQRLQIEESEADTYLPIAKKDQVELRTHQPGIDALVEAWVPAMTKQTEDDWGAEAKSERKIPWGWFALVGVIFGGGILWSIGQVQKAQSQVRSSVEKTQAITATDQLEEVQATKLVEEVESLIHAYYSAASPAELLSVVRHPERVKPLIEDYYSRFPFTKMKLNFIDVMQPVTIAQQGNFWLAVVILEGGNKRTTLAEIMPDGKAKMDWETAINYQPMPWDEFVEKRPRNVSIDFRVDAIPDNLFSHEFANEDEWMCFQLSAYDSVLVAYGYAKKDSQISKHILESVEKNNNQPTSIILRLRIPEGLKSRQGVIIEEFLNDRWTYVHCPSQAKATNHNND